MAVGRFPAFSLLRTSAGLLPEPTIGASLGPDGVQRAMRLKRVSVAEGPFTLLSCVCEKKADPLFKENHVSRPPDRRGS